MGQAGMQWREKRQMHAPPRLWDGAASGAAPPQAMRPAQRAPIYRYRYAPSNHMAGHKRLARLLGLSRHSPGLGRARPQPGCLSYSSYDLFVCHALAGQQFAWQLAEQRPSLPPPAPPLAPPDRGTLSLGEPWCWRTRNQVLCSWHTFTRRSLGAGFRYW